GVGSLVMASAAPRPAPPDRSSRPPATGRGGAHSRWGVYAPRGGGHPPPSGPYACLPRPGRDNHAIPPALAHPTPGCLVPRPPTRRPFLGRAAGLPAAVPLAGRLPAADKPPPSERVNVAVVGVGGQGTYNLHEVHNAGANIVALCDVAAERDQVV